MTEPQLPCVGKYVQAENDYGPADGPRSGITWHMAEGGGTVGYLSRPNPNGVSVHFVIEYSGRVVQMLPLGHANGSIRPTAIRTTDDDPYLWAGVPVVYGATAARAVLGRWHWDPNSATIGVEIEGFAKDGPNGDQAAAMVRLYVDLANRCPGIRSLAHRDFAAYKACPGKLIPWDRVGGHGPEGVETMSIYQRSARPGSFVIPAKRAVRAWHPAPDGWDVAKTRPAAPVASAPIPFTHHLGRVSGTTTPSSLLLVDEGHAYFGGLYVSTADVEETFDAVPEDPTPYSEADMVAAVAADRAKARITWEA